MEWLKRNSRLNKSRDETMMRKSMKSLSEVLLDVRYPFKLRLNFYSSSLVLVLSQEMISVA